MKKVNESDEDGVAEKDLGEAENAPCHSEVVESGEAPTVELNAAQPIYVASRASLPERGQMWRDFRKLGIAISSSWIDEDGDGQTGDFSELWERIANEIADSQALVLYAEAADFPLKGAIFEAGIALGMGKPVIVCLPDLGLLDRPYRPIGSWIKHPLVTRCDDISVAVALASAQATSDKGITTEPKNSPASESESLPSSELNDEIQKTPEGNDRCPVCKSEYKKGHNE